MTRDEILQANPILPFVEARGVKLKRTGSSLMALCPFHADKNPSMSIQEDKGRWKCFACGKGGTVIDWLMHEKGLSVKDAMTELGGTEPEAETYRLTDTYHYQDAYGRALYHVDRKDSNWNRKKFGQWRENSSGKRVNSLDGVTRVLYRLPEVLASDEVWLVEGEKCVHAAEDAGWVATTNCGGSGGWLDGYAESLEGKHVVVCPDNDKPGQKWRDAVLKSLEGRVASVRALSAPEPYNDIADIPEARRAPLMLEAYNAAARVDRGVSLAIYSASEIMEQYQSQVKLMRTRGLNLRNWLPSIESRPLVPGDLVTILADTGVGKSAALQNIAVCTPDLPTLFFEIELPGAQMGERFSAMTLRRDAWDVEKAVERGEKIDTSGWEHVYICPKSKMSVEDISHYIERAELKMGERPAVVMIDYIGLVKSSGSRYERLSNVAEGLKDLAKSANVVLLVASQVHRKEGGDNKVHLHDAKDSGSIENSSQLVLGMWKESPEELYVRVLKDTKGRGGSPIKCMYRGSQLFIREQVPDYGADADGL